MVTFIYIMEFTVDRIDKDQKTFTVIVEAVFNV